ncbi:hypothetical protein QBC47DRAFT_430691 [Echria macrotheca]|uniref:Uncharacterized protein n=1 Tax=Echria macrotheca TaxID=438768 RepID=A0AAJ0F3Q7_9PEZI|nr:hypothetical protein QBC47DRAFT_430691 [Echria macrotheca]
MNRLSSDTTPWSGLISLLGLALCLVGSGVVVGVSHNDAVESWYVQPAVLLAILSGASSFLFSTAMDTGVAVRFWLSAAKGTSLDELHYIWDHGRGLGLIPALRAGSRARTVAVLATAAYVIQFLASPLLQKATYQVVRTDMLNDSLSMDLATRIPEGWFGVRYNGKGMYENLHGNTQIREFRTQQPIKTLNRPGYACEGSCDGHVWGAGVSYECWTSDKKLDVGTNKTDDSTALGISGVITSNTTGQPFFRFTVSHLSDVDEHCIGTIREQTCYLRPATVEYPVTIQNSTITLRAAELGSMRSRDPYYSPGDDPRATKGTPAGTLLGLRSLVYPSIFTNETTFFDPDLQLISYRGPTPNGDMFYVTSAENPDPSPSRCRIKFLSPVDFAFNAIHEFMFRFALAAAADTRETQAFDVIRTARTQVFQWWVLGRPVSLSPLETAAALGRPILQHQPHATIGQILAEARISRRTTGLTVATAAVDEKRGVVISEKTVAAETGPPEIREI